MDATFGGRYDVAEAGAALLPPLRACISTERIIGEGLCGESAYGSLAGLSLLGEVDNRIFVFSTNCSLGRV